MSHNVRIYIYVYIYMCVCVCVCVRERERERERGERNILKTHLIDLYLSQCLSNYLSVFFYQLSIYQRFFVYVYINRSLSLSVLPPLSLSLYIYIYIYIQYSSSKLQPCKYCCISGFIWTLKKRWEKRLDLRDVLNKSLRQRPSKQLLYGHLPRIS